MNTLIFKLNLVKKIPPAVLCKKLLKRIFIGESKEKHEDLHNDVRSRSTLQPLKSAHMLNIAGLSLNHINTRPAEYISDMYISHHFDLLGSGWLKWSYDNISPGLEGNRYAMNLNIDADPEGNWLSEIVAPAHLEQSRKIWMLIKDTQYDPVDWQKDIKSGFRYNAKTWYKNQEHLAKNIKGVDIKVPWELGRLQHFPQMALLAQKLPGRKLALILAFKNQSLDFIASNPIRMGVQWSCTMDVAIRAANMAVAFDLFLQIDENDLLNEEFQQIYQHALWLHADHIFNHLEYRESLTSNHYLANICGLIVLSACLPESSQTEKWLQFCGNELIKEMDKQFFEDGGHFEGSTYYHAYCVQMVIYATAWLLALPDKRKKAIFSSAEFFPGEYSERLYRATCLIKDIQKQSGEIPQFGDSDSGKFFKFSPAGELINIIDATRKYKNLSYHSKEIPASPTDEYFDENVLDVNPILSAANSLFDKKLFPDSALAYPLESDLIKQLVKEQTFNVMKEKAVAKKESTSNNNFTFKKETVLQYPGDQLLDKDLQLLLYPRFQVYVFKSRRIYLAVCGCSNPRQKYDWAHVHNDKLSVELQVDGVDKFVDPGTFLYSPLPERRRQFRSVNNHNTLIVTGEEQNRWTEIDVFPLLSETEIKLVNYSKNELLLELSYRNIVQQRKITIREQEVIINDRSNKGFKINFNKFTLYSNGYGKWLKN